MKMPIGAGLALTAIVSLSAAGWAATPGEQDAHAKPAATPHEVHWTYAGDTGPEHWGVIDPAAAMCAKGTHQSPIDIVNVGRAEPMLVNFHEKATSAHVINNGHTVQVNVIGAGGISVGGKEYTLKQFHFHTPSENHIDGKTYPMVAHLVHQSDDGKLAVVAVMFEPGKSGLIDSLPHPDVAGQKIALPAGFDVAAMLPASKANYQFNGSLTTPPCTEGVQWIVLSHPMTVAPSTIIAFHQIMGDNARPLNPLNGRRIASAD